MLLSAKPKGENEFWGMVELFFADVQAKYFDKNV